MYSYILNRTQLKKEEREKKKEKGWVGLSWILSFINPC